MKQTPSKMNSKRSIPRHIIIKLSKDKNKREFWKHRKKASYHVQRIFNKIISRFLIRNSVGQEAVGWCTQSTKRKNQNCQPRLPYPAKPSFKSERKIKTFSNKQKLRKFITMRYALWAMFLNGFL